MALYHPTFALAKSKTTAPQPSHNYTARAGKPLFASSEKALAKSKTTAARRSCNYTARANKLLFASSEKALANKQNHIMLVLINLLALGLMAATIAIPATIFFNIYRATHEDHFC